MILFIIINTTWIYSTICSLVIVKALYLLLPSLTRCLRLCLGLVLIQLLDYNSFNNSDFSPYLSNESKYLKLSHDKKVLQEPLYLCKASPALHGDAALSF
uniref:Uncharacterized protein n=1 Tax=Morchella brunnea TaxID=1174671 RepID=A0A8K1I7Y5_9PEZI|nr:hypothetical protein LK370_mgp214 [Morchella brunnea]UBU98489.1 hypothetical protein [Morchella brunnea]